MKANFCDLLGLYTNFAQPVNLFIQL